MYCEHKYIGIHASTWQYIDFDITCSKLNTYCICNATGMIFFVFITYFIRFLLIVSNRGLFVLLFLRCDDKSIYKYYEKKSNKVCYENKKYRFQNKLLSLNIPHILHRLHKFTSSSICSINIRPNQSSA